MKITQLQEKVLQKGKTDKRVRVIILNGSKATINGDNDAYSDLDIVYYVQNYSDIIKDSAFFDTFGEVLISQSKDEQLFPTKSSFSGYIKMMQFKDGTRLDLSIVPIEALEDHIKRPDYYKILLDKDNILSDYSLPNQCVFPIKKPSQPFFDAAVKQFYWISLYVKKGIKRDHYPYAINHLDIMREALEAMISWHIGGTHGWDIELGKAGRKFHQYLPKETYQKYINSYPLANRKSILYALLIMVDLFHEISKSVSELLNYPIQINHQEILNTLET